MSFLFSKFTFILGVFLVCTLFFLGTLEISQSEYALCIEWSKSFQSIHDLFEYFMKDNVITYYEFEKIWLEYSSLINS